MNEFDLKAKDWDQDPARRERARAVADAIRANAPLSKTMTALEYGCGTGLLSFALYGDIGPVTLADSSEGMLETLRGKIAAAGLTGMTPLKLDLAADPPPAERFDLVYTLMTLHHIPDTDRILRQFHDLLKPGGWVAVSDLDKEDGSFHGPGFDGHLGFDRAALAAQLEAAGFTGVRAATAHELRHETAAGPKTFPMFLLVGRRP